MLLKMNNVQDYMNRRRAQIQQDLDARESTESARAGLIQAKTAEDTAMAGAEFADKLAEAGGKFQADMLTDVSAAGLGPMVLKGAARLATQRMEYMRSPQYWRQVQARRYAQSQGMNPDDAAPDPDDFAGNIRSAAEEAAQNVRQGVTDAAGNVADRAGRILGGVTERVGDVAGRAGQVVQGVANQARQALARDPIPLPEEEPIRFQNPVFDEEMADPGTFGDIPMG